MASDFTNNNSELEALFRKYESAPDSFVFAPLADAYRKVGMLEEAVEVCRKGVRKNPNYPSGHVVLGKCYFDLGEVEMADESFRAVLELDQHNLVALKYLGMIQAGRGRLDSARERFKHILELDPENREIRGMLEELHDAEEEPARRAITGGQAGGRPGRPAPHDGDVDDQFEGEPISLGDGDAGATDDLATTTLADIYAAQGYTDKAARIYHEVLRRQPDNLEIKQKLIELGEAGGHPPGDIADDGPSKPIPVEDGAGIRRRTYSKEPAEVAAAADARRKRVAVERGEDSVDGDKPAEESVPSPSSSDKRMEDRKSFDQFKRWLENMKD